MSDFAWAGVLLASAVSSLALGSYVVMALPYLDNAPYLQELKRKPRLALGVGLVMFAFFLAIFYLGARHLDQNTSGPLLLFAALVVGLPLSLLLGSETWDRHNGHGMNQVPGERAVLVATGIGLAEISGFALAFMGLMHVM